MRLNKKTLAIATVALFVAGTGTAALLDNFGTITGETNVQNQAVELVNNNNNVLTYDFNGQGDDVLGQTYRQVEGVQNNAGAATSVTFSTTCSRDDGSTTSTEGPRTEMDLNWNNYNGPACDGMETRFVEYYDDAGADFSDYSAPSSPDYTVSSDGTDTSGNTDFATIQFAVDSASSGDTILVETGTYDPTVVDKSVTIVAENQPTGSNPATVEAPNGQAFRVAASGVTVKGFEVTTDSTEGIYLTSGAQDASVLYNYVRDTSGDPVNSDNGIRVEKQAATIQDNRLEGFQHGVLIARNPDTSDSVTVKENDFTDMGLDGVYVVGKDADQTNHVISDNEFTNVIGEYTDGSEIGGAVLLHEDTSSIEGLEITGNNFVNSQVADVQTLGYDSNSETVDATNNWFGTNGIQTTQYVNADYETKATPVQLDAGETDKFGAFNSFAVNLAPGIYNVTTQVQPASN